MHAVDLIVKLIIGPFITSLKSRGFFDHLIKILFYLFYIYAHYLQFEKAKSEGSMPTH